MINNDSNISRMPQPPYKKPTAPAPDQDELKYWIFDGVAEATDGCEVEPDGWCPHGHVSWLIYLGYM